MAAGRLQPGCLRPALRPLGESVFAAAAGSDKVWSTEILLRLRVDGCPWDDDTRARAAELGYTDNIRNSNIGDPHRWTDGGVRGVDSAQTATGPPSTLTKLGLAPSAARVAGSSRMYL